MNTEKPLRFTDEEAKVWQAAVAIIRQAAARKRAEDAKKNVSEQVTPEGATIITSAEDVSKDMGRSDTAERPDERSAG